MARRARGGVGESQGQGAEAPCPCDSPTPPRARRATPNRHGTPRGVQGTTVPWRGSRGQSPLALLADTRAVVSVEAALALALVMLPLLLGLFDLGTALTVRLRVDRAVQAGLFGAWGVAGASAGQIAQAAQAGGGSGSPAVSASASLACYCLPPTGTLQDASPVECDDDEGECPSGQVLGDWATVTARASVSLPFPLPWVSSPLQLGATGTARVQ